MIKNPRGRPDATIKVADNKIEKAIELAAELESKGKKIQRNGAQGCFTGRFRLQTLYSE